MTIKIIRQRPITFKSMIQSIKNLDIKNHVIVIDWVKSNKKRLLKNKFAVIGGSNNIIDVAEIYNEISKVENFKYRHRKDKIFFVYENLRRIE